jgi:hypothetical protein
MADWRRVSRVGLTVVAAGAVALATVLLLTRGSPFSWGAPRKDASTELERSPRAEPVSNRSPVIRQTCGAAGFLARASAGPSSFKPSVSKHSASTRYRNEVGNYEFLAPQTWELRKHDSISKLVGPGHDFVVSLGPGPLGGLPRAYDEFVALADRTYGNVRLDKIDASCAAGDLSVWVQGRGTNAAAKPFDFLAVIIERPSGGTLGAFGAWNPKVPRARPLVRGVMESFRALPVGA